MYKGISKNIFIYGFTNGIKSLVPFIMLPILTSYLSTTDYGTLALIEVTILFLMPAISLNIHASINVEYFKLKSKDLSKYITNAILLSFISFIIFSICFIIFQDFFSNLLKIKKSLILLLPFFAGLRVITEIVLGIFQVSDQPKKFAVFTIMQTLLDFLFSFILIVKYNSGYIGRLIGIYFSFSFFNIVAFVYLFKKNLIGKLNFKFSKKILNFGIPLIPHAIGGTIMAMSDRYFISYFYNNDSVAYYTASYQLSAIMLLVGVSVNQAWAPILFKLLKEKQKIKKIYMMLFSFVILFIIIFFIIFLSKNILFNFLIDKKYISAKIYFLSLLTGFLFQSIYFLFTNFLFFYNKTKTLATITIFGAIFNIALNYFFIKIYGSIGVAYATTLTWILFSFLVFLKSYEVIKNKYDN